MVGRESKKLGRSEVRAEPPAQTDRSEAFRDGLSSLETQLDEELRAKGLVGEAPVDDRLTTAAEGVLDLYARLGRTLEETSVADALAGLEKRLRGDPADFGFDRDFERALMPLLRFLYRSWWRVQTRGYENLPASGPAVLVANSSAGLFSYDGSMLRFALREGSPSPLDLRPLLADSVLDMRMVGEVLSRCGAVRESADAAEQLLTRGQAIVVFPEGPGALRKSYAQRYALRPFAGADFVRVALRAGVPIVPVAIVGAEETHPSLARWDWMAERLGVPFLPITPTFPWLGIGGLLPLPSRWRIEVGKPLEMGGAVGPEAARDSRVVRRLAETTRQQLQELLDGTVQRRGGIFRRGARRSGTQKK